MGRFLLRLKVFIPVLTMLAVIVLGVFYVLRGTGLDKLRTILFPREELAAEKPILDVAKDVSACDEKEILKQAKLCTLLLGDPEKHGTGFVYRDSGYLVTNYHVIDHQKTGLANVFYDGRFHSLRIAGFSPEEDLAIIKLDDDLPGCFFANSQDLELAESVLAIGWPNSPYGDSTVTKGIFSRYVSFNEGRAPMIQTDTPINPGNSGGPLINKCGVVGVNTSKINWIGDSAPSEGIGYAISSNHTQQIVERLISEDDGSAKIPVEKLSPDTPTSENIDNDQDNNYLNPNSFVAYNYEQVMFWEDRKIYHEAMLNSWKRARDSSYVDQDRLEDLLDKAERSLELARILWDGYTNSKITYAQSLELKQEFLILGKEVIAITNEINVGSSINAYKNCLESWDDLEKEYDQDFSKQKEECDNILEVEN